MCGIVGIVRLDGSSKLLKSVQVMADTLRHRGPDDEGFAFFDADSSVPHIFGGRDTPESVYHSNCPYTPRQPFTGSIPANAMLALGHRRLSILDLSPAGHQPMCNEDKTLWIVYNGEIYNYIELRNELQSHGHRFASHTDTEVILHAYEEWGEACLDKFNGMWAFVIYDRRKNVLFGARDRFGVKPLYYYQDSHSFVFASEIKALVALPFVKKEINPRAAFDYLALSLVENNASEGFFQSIYELLPAHAFSYNLSAHTLNTWKYYILPFKDDWERFDYNTAERHTATIRELTLKAITSHLQSDVPVGACLSGGIDSSSIVCSINTLLQQGKIEQVGEHLRVFTASYNNRAMDESKWAKIVVDTTQTAWHQTFPTSHELLKDLEDVIYTQDIPFRTTSVYAQYRVMRLAKEFGVKVLLDGQGADELLTGYELYYEPFFPEMCRNLAFKDFFQEFLHLSNAPVSRKNVLLALLKLLGRRMLPASFIALKRVKHPSLTIFREHCQREFWEAYKERVEYREEINVKSVNSMLHEYMTDMKLHSLLRHEDRNSMRFSLESRTPFADDIHLIEAAFQIPSCYKIHNGWSKYLLRRAMKGTVPEPILLRKDKIGFATPERYWLQEIASDLKDYITSDIQEYLDVKKLIDRWDTIFEHQLPEIWRILNFAIWKKVYKL
ncbi:MAG: asparagine synthase (glutamine-hydrolyzing) [bacterium]|nr:asparagine synthase (glutamine-hydrolyzing) [bacterium]